MKKIISHIIESYPGEWVIVFKKQSQTESTTTFSAKMRELRKNNPKQVISFLKSFKSAFEQACDDRLEDAENVALLQAEYEYKTKI